MIFYFVNDSNLANYVDDNTPYTINYDVNAVIENLENDTSILIEWFNDNYFKITNVIF